MPFLLHGRRLAHEPAFLARGTMLYVPFLLLVVATGLTGGGGCRVDSRCLMLAAVVALHVLSIAYAPRIRPHAAQLPRVREGPRAAARRPTISSCITNEYSDPPLLFYMRDRYAQFVPSDWANAVASRRPGACGSSGTRTRRSRPALAAAVASLKPGEVVTAPGSRALEFVR